MAQAYSMHGASGPGGFPTFSPTPLTPEEIKRRNREDARFQREQEREASGYMPWSFLEGDAPPSLPGSPLNRQEGFEMGGKKGTLFYKPSAGPTGQLTEQEKTYLQKLSAPGGGAPQPTPQPQPAPQPTPVSSRIAPAAPGTQDLERAVRWLDRSKSERGEKRIAYLENALRYLPPVVEGDENAFYIQNLREEIEERLRRASSAEDTVESYQERYDREDRERKERIKRELRVERGLPPEETDAERWGSEAVGLTAEDYYGSSEGDWDEDAFNKRYDKRRAEYGAVELDKVQSPSSRWELEAVDYRYGSDLEREAVEQAEKEGRLGPSPIDIAWEQAQSESREMAGPEPDEDDVVKHREWEEKRDEHFGRIYAEAYDKFQNSPEGKAREAKVDEIREEARLRALEDAGYTEDPLVTRERKREEFQKKLEAAKALHKKNQEAQAAQAAQAAEPKRNIPDFSRLDAAQAQQEPMGFSPERSDLEKAAYSEEDALEALQDPNLQEILQSAGLGWMVPQAPAPAQQPVRAGAPRSTQEWIEARDQGSLPPEATQDAGWKDLYTPPGEEGDFTTAPSTEAPRAEAPRAKGGRETEDPSGGLEAFKARARNYRATEEEIQKGESLATRAAKAGKESFDRDVKKLKKITEGVLKGAAGALESAWNWLTSAGMSPENLKVLAKDKKIPRYADRIMSKWARDEMARLGVQEFSQAYGITNPTQWATSDELVKVLEKKARSGVGESFAMTNEALAVVVEDFSKVSGALLGDTEALEPLAEMLAKIPRTVAGGPGSPGALTPEETGELGAAYFAGKIQPPVSRAGGRAVGKVMDTDTVQAVQAAAGDKFGKAYEAARAGAEKAKAAPGAVKAKVKGAIDEYKEGQRAYQEQVALTAKREKVKTLEGFEDEIKSFTEDYKAKNNGESPTPEQVQEHMDSLGPGTGESYRNYRRNQVEDPELDRRNKELLLIGRDKRLGREIKELEKQIKEATEDSARELFKRSLAETRAKRVQTQRELSDLRGRDPALDPETTLKEMEAQKKAKADQEEAEAQQRERESEQRAKVAEERVARLEEAKLIEEEQRKLEAEEEARLQKERADAEKKEAKVRQDRVREAELIRKETDELIAKENRELDEKLEKETKERQRKQREGDELEARMDRETEKRRQKQEKERKRKEREKANKERRAKREAALIQKETDDLIAKEKKEAERAAAAKEAEQAAAARESLRRLTELKKKADEAQAKIDRYKKPAARVKGAVVNVIDVAKAEERRLRALRKAREKLEAIDQRLQEAKRGIEIREKQRKARLVRAEALREVFGEDLPPGRKQVLGAEAVKGQDLAVLGEAKTPAPKAEPTPDNALGALEEAMGGAEPPASAAATTGKKPYGDLGTAVERGKAPIKEQLSPEGLKKVSLEEAVRNYNMFFSGKEGIQSKTQAKMGGVKIDQKQGAQLALNTRQAIVDKLIEKDPSIAGDPKAILEAWKKAGGEAPGRLVDFKRRQLKGVNFGERPAGPAKPAAPAKTEAPAKPEAPAKVEAGASPAQAAWEGRAGAGKRKLFGGQSSIHRKDSPFHAVEYGLGTLGGQLKDPMGQIATMIRGLGEASADLSNKALQARNKKIDNLRSVRTRTEKSLKDYIYAHLLEERVPTFGKAGPKRDMAAIEKFIEDNFEVLSEANMDDAIGKTSATNYKKAGAWFAALKKEMKADLDKAMGGK